MQLLQIGPLAAPPRRTSVSAWRESVTPRRWLASGACVMVAVYALAGAAALALVERAREGSRVPRGTVTGRAAAAVGDSGAFAMSGPPPGVQIVIPRADAESAAVAYAYWFAPSRQIIRGQHSEDQPTERRHVCGRVYYVRAVVALPNSAAVPSVNTDPEIDWGPAWVVPVCDDAGFARTTVEMADAPTSLRVVLGDQPGDVPELVHPPNGHMHLSRVPPQLTHDWERGIALTPEAAVAVAAMALAGIGARVAEVPEAFMTVAPPERSAQYWGPPSAWPGSQSCPRWRLTLDRAVRLRGTTSGRLVRTRVVYVARDRGCSGVPVLEIPRPAQPTTLPYMYGVRPGWPPPGPPPYYVREGDLPPMQYRWAALRVTEPVWFEEARLAAGASRGAP